ncbi:MAG TPA: hypothetical protein VOA87_23055 [Thermoanaerobaculia bacterium]|nr:hypothetical protein [Thermoanaerobaculia bacterium]
MVLPKVRDQILSDLDRLPPEKQERAAELVHGLVSPLPEGASIEDLLKVAGILDDESAREMMEAIEEGCEEVGLANAATKTAAVSSRVRMNRA